ncbi:MAG: MoaD/ThiS family protein [PVC group bacterium]
MPTVKLFGVLRDRARTGRVSISGKKTILEILKHLAAVYGSPIGELLLETRDGEMVRRPPVVILINGVSQTDPGRVVGEEESVTIFPSVAGG